MEKPPLKSVLIVCALIMVIGIVSCGEQPPTLPYGTVTPSFLSSATTAPTGELIASPTQALPTLTITNTLTFNPTITSTPVSLDVTAIPVQRDTHAMDVDNIEHKISRLLRIGTGTPNDIAFSPDGKYLAIATGLGVFFYNANTFEQASFIDVSSDVRLLSFSTDGKKLLLASYLRGNTAISLWDVDTGKKIIELEKGFDSWVQRIFYTDTGFAAAVGHEGECGVTCASDYFSPRAKVWSTSTGRMIHEEEIGDIIGFSTDGKTLYFSFPTNTSFDLKTVTMLNVGQPQGTDVIQTIPGSGIESENEITATSIDKHFKAVLSLRNRSNIAVIDLQTNQVLKSLYFDDSGVLAVEKVSIKGIETYIAATSDQLGRIILWDLSRGVKMSNSESTGYYLSALAFSPDQRTLASVNSSYEVWLWNVETLQPIRMYPTGDQYIKDIRFDSTGTNLNISSAENNYELDLGSGKLTSYPYTFMIPAKGGIGTITSPSGDFYEISIALDNLSFSLNDLQTKASVKFPTITGYQNDWFSDATAISRDGNYLAVGFSEGPIGVWNIHTQKLLSWMTGHQSKLTQVDRVSFSHLNFNSQTNLLLSVGSDETTRLWNIQSGEQLALLNVCCTAEFSPDGRILVTASDGVIRVWGIAPWP
jgi:WD40 repeat protein